MTQSPVSKRTSQPIDLITKPFQRFAHQEASGGIVLLVFTLAAMVWANSPWSDFYHHLWHETNITLGIGAFALTEPVEIWINDGLMAIFFFVVGLEIKREVLTGDLSSPKQAMLPIAAAFGGMAVPALIYIGFNAGTAEISGWGVPMATDIAFALGVLALLGEGVPLSLKIFLAALAIADDLGAVLVIALFYSSDISFGYLAIGGFVLGLMMIANRLGVRGPIVYSILGFCLWIAFLQSGVHATIAGVLGAMTIPASTLINEERFIRRGRRLLDKLESSVDPAGKVAPGLRQPIVSSLEDACNEVEPPLIRLERTYHSWVSFLIMPLFALANAGIELGSNFLDNLTHHSTLGIILGLVLGKQIGVTLFAWLAVRLGLATLPEGASWKLIYGMGWLAGIGFTMSLFIAGLAFPGAEALETAKAGVLVASLVAGVVGFVLLKRWIPKTP
ncbi:MAG: Na+/H+ antiporter NhaA [bacterium]|nr:Na+/H+ antiporter NhaA [bacterium]